MLRPRLRVLRIDVGTKLPKRENPVATPRVRGRRGVERRRAYLSMHPLCVRCQAKGIIRAAIVVDHITPLSEGGADDDSNKQGLCYFHDRAKVAAENRARAYR